MSTLAIAELKEQVDTDYTDVALQTIIDAVERDITVYAGPLATLTHEFDTQLLHVLRLPVQTSAITSVTEYTGAMSEPTQTALSADDYELSDNGFDLRRLSDGTNPRSTWSWHVVVVLTPVDDTDRRKQVAIELARMEIIHTGYLTEKTGDWSATTRDLMKERARILRRLSSPKIA